MKKKEIDIMHLDAMTVPDLKTVAQKLKLSKVADKSGKQLSDEINNLCKGYMAGQVNFSTFSF